MSFSMYSPDAVCADLADAMDDFIDDSAHTAADSSSIDDRSSHAVADFLSVPFTGETLAECTAMLGQLIDDEKLSVHAPVLIDPARFTFKDSSTAGALQLQPIDFILQIKRRSGSMNYMRCASLYYYLDDIDGVDWRRSKLNLENCGGMIWSFVFIRIVKEMSARGGSTLSFLQFRGKMITDATGIAGYFRCTAQAKHLLRAFRTLVAQIHRDTRAANGARRFFDVDNTPACKLMDEVRNTIATVHTSHLGDHGDAYLIHADSDDEDGDGCDGDGDEDMTPSYA